MKWQSFTFLQEDPVIIDAGVPGPTVMILGGIHGDEICGVFAVKSLIDQRATCALKKGKLILMYGNLQAIRANLRQVDENLNRMFHTDPAAYTPKMQESYAYLRAMQIKPYLDQTDVLLDLHSVGNQDAVPFVICEENGREIARHFSVPIVCSGLDDAHPGGTDGYMNKSGKIGLCLECGQHTDPGAVELAQEGITTFLAAMGMLDADSQLLSKLSPTVQPAQRQIRVATIYKNRYASFQLAKNFEEFEEVQVGELLGYDGDAPVYAEKTALILFARSRTAPGEECFCLAEEFTPPQQ